MPPSSSTSSTLPLASTPPLTHNHTQSNLTSLTTYLQHTHSIPHTTTPSLLASKSSTPHSHAPPTHLPKAILHPKSTADVSAIMKACHERDIAVVPFAGGTSLGGALANTRAGVCVDFGGMTEVGGIRGGDGDVWVQAGVEWAELNERLEDEGWFWPPDPARGARVGGMVAMSCSGTNTYRYGTIKSWILSLTIVLADGTTIKTRNRPRKSSAGYDLTHLLIGSEGTLGLVTEAVLKLAPLPRNLHVGLVTFERLQDGVDVALAILGSGHALEGMELADRECARAVNASGLAELELVEAPTLFVKFAGPESVVREQIAFVRELCEKHGGEGFETSSEKERVDAVWGARKCLGYALVKMKERETDLFLSTDAAVPVSRMAELVERTGEIVRAVNPEWFCASVGHVGDGNVHTAIICPQEAKPQAEALLAQIQRLALELDGTITGEHGIGLKLRDLLVEEVGQAGVDAMRRIKMAMDPKGLLNPDKVFRLEGGV